jgi:hypothetical protein
LRWNLKGRLIFRVESLSHSQYLLEPTLVVLGRTPLTLQHDTRHEHNYSAKPILRTLGRYSVLMPLSW